MLCDVRQLRHHRWNGIRQQIARLRDLELLLEGLQLLQRKAKGQLAHRDSRMDFKAKST